MRIFAIVINAFVASVVIWTILASRLFVWVGGLSSSFPSPWTTWWRYAHPGISIQTKTYLIGSGIAAAIPILVVGWIVIYWILHTAHSHRLIPIKRGISNNHSRADYLSIPEMQALFPDKPDPVIGGVVVGEADRVDIGQDAHIPFDPDDRATWGNGGKAPLLIDHCKRGSTHSMVIGGGGTYKSTTLVTSLLTFRKSIFCLDPSEELRRFDGD